MSVDGDSGPRPWLAGLLALLVTGLGHAYLRQWARALAWFLLTFAVTVAFVPESAIEAALAGTTEDPFALAMPLLVVCASALDAYLLARRARAAPGAPAAEGGGVDPDDTCPNCGREIDPDIDFCPWCSAELAPSDAESSSPNERG